MLHLNNFKKKMLGTESQKEKIWGIILNRYLTKFKFVVDIRVYTTYNSNILQVDIFWHYDQDIIKDNDNIYQTKYHVNSNGTVNKRSNNFDYEICNMTKFFSELS